jgi:hypothetical protein
MKNRSLFGISPDLPHTAALQLISVAAERLNQGLHPRSAALIVGSPNNLAVALGGDPLQIAKPLVLNQKTR